MKYFFTKFFSEDALFTKIFKSFSNFVAKNFQNSHSSFKVATTFQVATTSSDSSKIFAQVYKNKNWLVV